MRSPRWFECPKCGKRFTKGDLVATPGVGAPTCPDDGETLTPEPEDERAA